MKIKTTGWVWAVALLLLVGGAREALGISACSSARFNDWKDLGFPRPDCQHQGMPQWWVSKPYMSLWMEDIPLSYKTSSGQPMEFRWTYNQRTLAPGDYGIREWDGANLVPIRFRTSTIGLTTTNSDAAWCHDWWSEIVLWDTRIETNFPGEVFVGGTNAYLPFSSNYEALVILGNGGTLYFNGTNASTPNGTLKARLEIIGQISPTGGPEVLVNDNQAGIEPYGTGDVWVDSPQYGFRVVYPDGSRDIYAFFLLAYLLGSDRRPCPYGTGDPRCGGSSPPQDYTARAYLTQRIDPQGRITRIGYRKVGGLGQPYYNVGWVVDSDGRTNTYYYNSSDGTKLARIVDAYGRTNSVTYDPNQNIISSLTDGAGLTSSFQYAPSVIVTDTTNSTTTSQVTIVITSNSGAITNLTTPYGTNIFTYAQEQEVGAVTEYQARAILASEPDSAHQLYYYRHTNSLSSQLPVTPVVTNYVFDDGATGYNHQQLNYRDTFDWDRRQFTALSVSDWSNLTNALAALVDSDYRKATMNHWLLDSNDQLSVTADLSVVREASPDAAGSTEGAWSCYAYPGKPAGEPEMAGAETYPSCLARVLPDGSTQFTEWDYTTNGLLLQERESYTLADGTVGTRTNCYAYATNNVDLVATTNTLGQYVNLGYNTNHQVASITDALGQISTLGYDTTTRHLTSLALVGGQTASFSYYVSNAANANGNMLSNVVWSPTARAVTLTWTNGLPRIVHATGTNIPDLWVTNFWDGLNRSIGTSFTDGTGVSNVFDRLDVGATKDRLGYWTYFGHDAFRHLTSVTDALSNLTTLTWCDCGALSSVTDTLTNTTHYFYNNQGLLTNIAFPDTSSLTYTYDAVQRLVQVADGSARTLTAGYNNQGLLTAVSNTQGALERIVYDTADRPMQVTDAGNVTITNVFDPLNRTLARIWPDGVGETYLWATNGLVAYTNRNGKVTRYLRDNAGRLTAVTNANLEVVQFGYNSLNQTVSLVDGLNHATAWHYNQYGWVTNKVDALSREIRRYSYNANGQVTNRWMPASGNTGYGYDAVGNLFSIAYPNQTVAYAHDALHRLTNMVDATGNTAFSYTPAGQLQSENGPWSSDTLTYGYTQRLLTTLTLAQSSGNWSQSYGYDLAWRMISLTSPAGDFVYNYNVHPASSLISAINLPNGSSITNGYDALARLTGTALVNQWSHVLDAYNYGYDLLGLRTNIVRNLGLTVSTVSASYDNIGQLTGWLAQEANGTPRQNERLGWAYDQSDNLLFRTNGALVQTFNVDAVNELTNITRNGTLTLSGNTPAPMTSVTVNGQAAQVYGDFTFARTNLMLTNGANSFTNVAQNVYSVSTTNITAANLPTATSLLFDGNGNLTNDGTRSFAYDTENQLTNIVVTNATTSASTKTEFVYDGLGRRRIGKDYSWSGSVWSKTNEVRYVYDRRLAIQERDTNNNVLVTYTRGLDFHGSLQRGGGIGGLLARTDANGSTYYHADGAGNITALIDGSENVVARYLYDPFGRVTGKWGTLADANVMQFSSMPRHVASGLSLFASRAYNPMPQQWLQQDSIEEMGGVNLRAFVQNNPLGYVDPYGEDLHLVAGGGTLYPAGPFGYLAGDTFGENLVAGAYNIMPQVDNRAVGELNTMMGMLSAFDQGMEDSLTWLTGDPQLANALNNTLPFIPVMGLPEDAAKLGQMAKILEDAMKAAEEAEKAAKAEKAARLAAACEKVANQMKKAGLPTTGSRRFIPQLVKNAKGDMMIQKAEIMTGPKAGKVGYVDIDGNTWIKDAAHANYPEHWDVQINGGLSYERVGLDGNSVTKTQ